MKNSVKYSLNTTNYMLVIVVVFSNILVCLKITKEKK